MTLQEAYAEFDDRSHQFITDELEEDIFRDILQRFALEFVEACVPEAKPNTFKHGLDEGCNFSFNEARAVTLESARKILGV